jgi:cellulose synthase/poly-beta-1,6-N-acetylglucosamine synthase-like glycosyltransferase
MPFVHFAVFSMRHFVDVLLLGVTAFNLVIAGTEACWRLYAWRRPDAAEDFAWPAPVPAGSEELGFDLIVPLRDEAAVIGDTLRGLLRQRHGQFQIFVSLCDDDLATSRAVQQVIDELQAENRVQIVVGHYPEAGKALQLNQALRSCTSDVVGVIDAEDDVAEDLLAHVEALFRTSGADVVQGGVQLMNLGDRPAKWFQVHNVLEYFFWFTSRMAFHSRTGFVPLGGNTVFIRREMLEAAGGWPLSVTEDCALGVKLSAEHGAKIATAYSPGLATREECPPSVFNKAAGSLFWQRDRWIRGFCAEFAAGRWLRIPTVRRKVFAGYLLATPVLQAVSFVMLPVAILAGLLTKAPIGLAIAIFSPFLPISVTMISQLIGLSEFGRQYGRRPSRWHYLSILCLTPLYQVVLSAAALVALYKFLNGDSTWYKTGRAASHREVAPTALEGVTA